MKNALIILLFAVALPGWSFVDLEYPSGVCFKEQSTAARKHTFEVAMEKKSQCCQMQKFSCQNCYVRGLYLINGNGEKFNCRYPQIKRNPSSKHRYAGKRINRLRRT